MNIEYWLLFAAIGVPVGFLSGLLGIGGGSVLVPVFALIFDRMGMPREVIMQATIATSLACIVSGGSSSARAHHSHGAVVWEAVLPMAPGIVAGSIVATSLVHLASPTFLKLFFVGFMFATALQLFTGIGAKPSRQLPGRAGFIAAGFCIGLVSGMVGIGGAVLTVAFMSWCSTPIHKAVGTAAAVGVPIAIAGALMSMVTGWGTPGIPNPSLGYVYLPAMIGISITSVLAAPWGAKVAHSLPVKRLKQAFMVFLLALALRMAMSV
jgi:uncharacterized protein